MSKSKVLGLLYIVIGGIIIVSVFNFFGEDKQSKNLPLNTEIVHELTNIQELKIESAVTAIFVSPSTDDQLQITLIQNDSDGKHALTLVPTENGKKLSVEVTDQRKFRFGLSNIRNFNSKLMVKIPQHYKGELDLETATGSINIDKLVIDELKAESTTGGLKLDNMTSKDIKTTTTTGSIHLNNVVADSLKAESTTGSIHLNSKIEKLDIETTTGSIHVNQQDIFHDSKLESTTGSIHVNLSDSPNSLHITFQSEIGKVHVNKQGYNSIQNDDDKHEFVFGSGEIKLDVETSTGSFHLN